MDAGFDRRRSRLWSASSCRMQYQQSRMRKKPQPRVWVSGVRYAGRARRHAPSRAPGRRAWPRSAASRAGRGRPAPRASRDTDSRDCRGSAARRARAPAAFCPASSISRSTPGSPSGPRKSSTAAPCASGVPEAASVTAFLHVRFGRGLADRAAPARPVNVHRFGVIARRRVCPHELTQEARIAPELAAKPLERRADARVGRELELLRGQPRQRRRRRAARGVVLGACAVGPASGALRPAKSTISVSTAALAVAPATRRRCGIARSTGGACCHADLIQLGRRERIATSAPPGAAPRVCANALVPTGCVGVRIAGATAPRDPARRRREHRRHRTRREPRLARRRVERLAEFARPFVAIFRPLREQPQGEGLELWRGTATSGAAIRAARRRDRKCASRACPSCRPPRTADTPSASRKKPRRAHTDLLARRPLRPSPVPAPCTRACRRPRRASSAPTPPSALDRPRRHLRDAEIQHFDDFAQDRRRACKS